VNYTEKIFIKLQLHKAESDKIGYRLPDVVELFLSKENDY